MSKNHTHRGESCKLRSSNLQLLLWLRRRQLGVHQLMQPQLGANLKLSRAIVALIRHYLVDGHLVLLDAAGVGVGLGADVAGEGSLPGVQTLVHRQLVAIDETLSARRASKTSLVNTLVHHQHVLIAHAARSKTLAANVALVRSLAAMQQHVVAHRLQRGEPLVTNLALESTVAGRVAHHAVRRLEVLAHPLQREKTLVAKAALQSIHGQGAHRVAAVVRVLVHVEAGRVVVSAAAHFANVRPLAGVQPLVHQKRRRAAVRPTAVRAHVQFQVAPLKVLAHAAPLQIRLASRTQRAVELSAHAHSQRVARVKVLLELERRTRHVDAVVARVRRGVHAFDVVAALGAAQRESQLAVGAGGGAVGDALGVRAQVSTQVGQRVERLEARFARQRVQSVEHQPLFALVLLFDRVEQHRRLLGLSATHTHARRRFSFCFFTHRWAVRRALATPGGHPCFATLTSATQCNQIK